MLKRIDMTTAVVVAGLALSGPAQANGTLTFQVLENVMIGTSPAPEVSARDLLYAEPELQDTLPADRASALPQDASAPIIVADPATTQPFLNIGKLGFKKYEDKQHKTKRCTAQFVGSDAVTGKNVLMTAAHCVFNVDADIWNSNFTFYRAYDAETGNPTYAQKVGWSCIAIYEEYHVPSKDRSYDYAFILTDIASTAEAPGYLTLKLAAEPQSVTSVGYPANFGSGKSMVQVAGVSQVPEGGTVEMLNNPMNGGSSGGAWIADFLQGSAPAGDLNTASGLNSFHKISNDQNEYGPVFDGNTQALMSFVAGGCNS